jgi:hypothetical protein
MNKTFRIYSILMKKKLIQFPSFVPTMFDSFYRVTFTIENLVDNFL